MAVRGMTGSVSILSSASERFVFQVPSRDLLGIEHEIAGLGNSAVGARHADSLLRHFSACIGAYYEVSHVVMVGPYWERAEVEALSSAVEYGITFCMVERPGNSGSSFVGDILPQAVLEYRLQERRIELQNSCRRRRANCIICPGSVRPIEALVRTLAGDRLL
jgi:hypothetical protein